MDCPLDSAHVLPVSVVTEILKMSKLLHNNNNNDTKAIAIPQIFSGNSQAKKKSSRVMVL